MPRIGSSQGNYFIIRIPGRGKRGGGDFKIAVKAAIYCCLIFLLRGDCLAKADFGWKMVSGRHCHLMDKMRIREQ